MSEEIKILKVKFNKVTLKEASDLAIKWSLEENQRHIVTPNPEITLEAQKNSKFLKILNKADLSIADGIGILWAAKFHKSCENTKNIWIKRVKWLQSLFQILSSPQKLKQELPERVTGVDLMKSICKKATKKGIPIFLLGAKPGVAQNCKAKLESAYKGLEIIDTDSSSPIQEEEIIKKVNSSEAKILFVAYGAPKQEFWINKNLFKMPEVKVAIGVGGAFDFIAEQKNRAPKWIQKFGLEWAYRLYQEPKRFKRIYNATVKFPFKVLRTETQLPTIKKRIQHWLDTN